MAARIGSVLWETCIGNCAVCYLCLYTGTYLIVQCGAEHRDLPLHHFLTSAADGLAPLDARFKVEHSVDIFGEFVAELLVVL